MRKMVYGLMKKEKMRTDKNIPDLLAKAMTGALTGEERRLLDDWRERDEDNARLCDEVLPRSLWNGNAVRRRRWTWRGDMRGWWRNIGGGVLSGG